MKIKGFTLIELLVVIVIIGILVTIGVASYNNSRRQARDAKRSADLSTYSQSLQNYAIKTGGIYPDHNGEATGVCALIEATVDSQIPCPTDPVNDGGNVYVYQSFPVSSTTPVSYALYTQLETPPFDYVIFCANGTRIESATVPTETVCS